MVGRRHDHVIRDIRKIIEQLNETKIGGVEISFYFTEDTYKNGKEENNFPSIIVGQGNKNFHAHYRNFK